MRSPAIVAGFDGSPASRRAVARAVELAERFGARLVLVHALSPPRGMLPRAARTGTIELLEHHRRLAQDALDEVARVEAGGRVPVTSAIRLDEPARALEAVARDESARLIVVGRTGASAARRMLMGSVAMRLALHSGVEVLLVPNRAERSGRKRR